MKKRIIKFLIDKAKRSKMVQSIFEQPIDLNQFSVEGTFHDSNGNKHNLYKGYRSKIRPGWERIFNQDGKTIDKSSEQIEKIVKNGRIAVERLMPIINIYSKAIENCRILEIGCSSGGTTFSFAEKKPVEVIGTEFSGYKIEALDNKSKLDASDLNEVNANLKEIRDLVKNKFQSNGSVAKFMDDDICNSKLEKNSFDLICSWDVLEHIHNPFDALKNIHDLLSDDGIAIHEYNPFFSLSGGHSACTIDFPWGHVILNSDDFKKFNEEKQPSRTDKSMSFYTSGLNRMTFSDLQKYCKEAKLEIISLVKFPKEQHLRMLNKKILELCENNYPSLRVDDLITPKVIVIMKKAS